jgi:hypothetical protein
MAAKKINRRKSLTAVLAVVSACILSVGAALGYLTDTALVTNTFAVGDLDVKNREPEYDKFRDEGYGGGLPVYGGIPVVEPETYTPKDPYVSNVGGVDAFIRVTVTFPAYREYENYALGDWKPLFLPYYDSVRADGAAAAPTDRLTVPSVNTAAFDVYDADGNRIYDLAAYFGTSGNAAQAADGSYVYKLIFYYIGDGEAGEPAYLPASDGAEDAPGLAPDSTPKLFDFVYTNAAYTDSHDFLDHSIEGVSVYTEGVQRYIRNASGEEAETAYDAFAYLDGPVYGNNDGESQKSEAELWAEFQEAFIAGNQEPAIAVLCFGESSPAAQIETAAKPIVAQYLRLSHLDVEDGGTLTVTVGVIPELEFDDGQCVEDVPITVEYVSGSFRSTQDFTATFDVKVRFIQAGEDAVVYLKPEDLLINVTYSADALDTVTAVATERITRRLELYGLPAADPAELTVTPGAPLDITEDPDTTVAQRLEYTVTYSPDGSPANQKTARVTFNVIVAPSGGA